VSAQVFKSLGSGYLAADAGISAEDPIRLFNDRTKSIRSWSPIRTVAGFEVMVALDPSSTGCFGFNQRGGLNSYGPTYQLRGYFCRAAAAGLTDDDIKGLLDALMVRDRVEPQAASE
jgi:hypothetical protein